MSEYNAKNYTEQGGDVTHIGGKLVFDEGGSVEGLDIPGVEPAKNQAASTATNATNLAKDFNALLTKLKNAGIMVADTWNVSVLACPSTGAMPTTETASNSGHATVTIDGTAIKITLDCEVDDLEDASCFPRAGVLQYQAGDEKCSHLLQIRDGVQWGTKEVIRFRAPNNDALDGEH